jgi:hypothetical protein
MEAAHCLKISVEGKQNKKRDEDEQFYVAVLI